MTQSTNQTADPGLTGKDLIEAGWSQGRALGMALKLGRRLETDGMERSLILNRLQECWNHPETLTADPEWSRVATTIMDERDRSLPREPAALGEPKPYPIWGAALIDPGAIAQMDVAMSLPVTTRGALMPDAHIGYGLPIGGVLETRDVVIPYAVGSDIACRMRLTVVDAEANLLDRDHDRLKEALVAGTVFGAGRESGLRVQMPVLDADWSATPFLKGLRDLARRQIGTSGSGNHFVEWGVVDWEGRTLLALMSHSGSRGVGFKIADRYSKLAESLRNHDLPPDAIRLAWLQLDSDGGREYWTSMELAGQFASENHAVIHERVLTLAGLNEDRVAVVENHHNFAWAEMQDDGAMSVVHRKGATPAGEGVMGVIPGSMGTPGYVVAGKGLPESLESASHGGLAAPWGDGRRRES